jgi:LysM repeat protein
VARLKPAPILLTPSRIARVPDGELIALPRALTPAAVQPVLSRAARPKRSSQIAIKPVPSLPEPVTLVTRPAPAAPRSRSAEMRPSDGLQRGSTPDRIVLPVYRLARLPETLSPDRSYTVRSGDTLSRIARQHGVTPRSILVANGLLGASELTPGRRLSIPGTITIAYNDEPIGFDVQPRVEKGMAITPFRQIFEHAGGVVRYQPDAHLVSAKNPEKEIRIKIGSREALVNSAVVLMDRAAFLDSGRTMVPVKFMTQALDLKAEYDLKTGAIYLIHK